MNLSAEFLSELSEEARSLAACCLPERAVRSLHLLALAADAVRCEVEAAVPSDGAVLLLAALRGLDGKHRPPGNRSRQYMAPLRRTP